MGEVVDMPGRILREGAVLEPDFVLEKAKGKLKSTLVIGIDDDGEFYFAGTVTDRAQVNLLLDRAKHFMLTGVFV